MTSLSLSSAPPPIVENALKMAGVKPEDAIGFLRCSDSPEAIRMCQIFDSLVDTEKKAITIDYLCAAARDPETRLPVHPSRALGIITEQMFTHSASVTNMIAAAAAPRVMEKSIRYAGMRDGYQDRKLLLQTTGVAPVPKNQATYVNITGNKIDNSKTINVIPTLESVLGEVDKVLDAESR